MPSSKVWQTATHKIELEAVFKDPRLYPTHYRPCDFLRDSEYKKIIYDLEHDFLAQGLHQKIHRSHVLAALQSKMQVSLTLSFHGSVADTKHFGPGVAKKQNSKMAEPS